MMKRNGTALSLLAAGMLAANPLWAQTPAAAPPASSEKPRAEGRAEKVTPLKMHVVLTEFDGDKKVKSLPYAFVVDSDRNGYQFTKMRVGTKVPIYAGPGKDTQYIDVGTNIDCRVTRGDASTFRVELVIERSWVDSYVTLPASKTAADDKSTAPGPQPIVQQFKTEMEASLVDGQSAEVTQATDPVSGKMLKIEVSLLVLK
jgi:hypothetical protein